MAGDGLTGIEIKLAPQAVLSGRVLDQDGDLWPHANIVASFGVEQGAQANIESADFAGASEVDDRGEFRVAGLAPGRYYVQAEPDAMWEQTSSGR